jgi:glucans biosynthesis protein
MIVFRTEQALWSGEATPFRIEFHHRGYLFRPRVDMVEVRGEKASPVGFRRDLFFYGQSLPPMGLPLDVGFAGVRVLYPLNEPKKRDELISFLGSSYFRALGEGQRYGTSARGLAIDTAGPKGEEFPVFRKFWIVRPADDARSVTLLALLDSVSVAGAYEFIVTPGLTTTVDVRACLYLRRAVAKLGLAPLTSMFLYSEDCPGRSDAARPAVHDSDGLLVATEGGEWLWRPLDAPPEIRVYRFGGPTPRGFGLMQRDRDPAHYRDTEAVYERRPSVWIEPRGAWGPGEVELVEVPTRNEWIDNIVAYWVPGRATKAGDELTFEHRIEWASRDPATHTGGRVVSTRVIRPTPATGEFIIEFTGGALAGLAADQKPEAVVTTTGGSVGPVSLEKLSGEGGWQCRFVVTPADKRVVELRAFLRRGKDVLTETWSYAWSP